MILRSKTHKTRLAKGRDCSRLRSKYLLCRDGRDSRICFSTSLLEGAAQGGAHFYPDHESARGTGSLFNKKNQEIP
jgi:hypothetical protein